MKRNTKIISLISVALLVVALLFVIFIKTFDSRPVTQKEKIADLKGFTITIEMTERGVKLHSLEGSAWLDLELYPLTKRALAFDEYGMAAASDSGMTDFVKPVTDFDPNLADYLIAIAKTENGVVLKGLEGTAWKTLSFTLQVGDKQSINQNGMI